MQATKQQLAQARQRILERAHTSAVKCIVLARLIDYEQQYGLAGLRGFGTIHNRTKRIVENAEHILRDIKIAGVQIANKESEENIFNDSSELWETFDILFHKYIKDLTLFNKIIKDRKNLELCLQNRLQQESKQAQIL